MSREDGKIKKMDGVIFLFGSVHFSRVGLLRVPKNQLSIALGCFAVLFFSFLSSGVGFYPLILVYVCFNEYHL